MFTYKQYFILRCILIGIFLLMVLVFVFGGAEAECTPRTAVVDVHPESGLRCRKGPGPEYNDYFLLADNARVLVLEEKNGWGLVAWPKYPEYPMGWVCMDYLK